MKNNSERKAFNFFNLHRDGPGVEKGEKPVLDKPGFKNFFKLLGRKFNQIVSANLMIVIGNFPMFFALAVLAGFFSYTSVSPLKTTFAQMNGAMTMGNTSVAHFLGIFGMQGEVTVFSTTDIILLCLTALLIFTIGPVTAGITYIFKNIIKQEPIFIFQDFFNTIKKNIKQALPYGIFDGLITVLIVFDVEFFRANMSDSFISLISFYGALFIGVLYYMMRTYIYIMMVTFDMKLTKMFKNALLFTVMGIKRNIFLLLGTIVILVINFLVLAFVFPLGVILPFVITLSLIYFLSVYCAFPIIKKHMIDPYYSAE